MAVTYIQQPEAGSIQSSDNPITFVFSSTQTAQPNFCFIVQTIVDGITVSTDMVFPDRGSRGRFEAMEITLPYVRAIARPVGLASVQNLPTLAIRVAERYGTTPVTYASVLSNTCKLTKACCDDETYSPGWIEANYTPSTKWLTDAPESTLLLSRRYPIWASIFNSSAMYTQVEVYVYGASGPSIGILSTGVMPVGDRVNVQVTPAMIEAEIFPLTMDDVHRLEIYMNTSDPLHVQFIEEDCDEYHQLSWLNNLGAYDQFLFTHNRDSEHTIEINEYKKQFGAWNQSNVWEWDALKSGDTQYAKQITPTGTLYSGWISQANQNWLNQIYHSVDCVILEGDKVEKITVTNTQATNMKVRFEDLLNFQVNYKKSNFRSITQ